MRTLTEGEVAEHLDRIAEQGYTVVEDAIEPDLVDELVATLDRLERELGVVPADNAFEGRRTTRIYNLLTHGDVFARVPVHANVLPLVEGVLDPGCLLSSLSSIAPYPASSRAVVMSVLDCRRTSSRRWECLSVLARSDVSGG